MPATLAPQPAPPAAPPAAPPPVIPPTAPSPAPPQSAAAGDSYPACGFPTPAMLAAVGDPPEGTAISAADYERLVTEFRTEWVGGLLEYLPMNSDRHHAVCGFLYRTLFAFLIGAGYDPAVRFAGVGLRVPTRIRGPDVLALLDGDDPRRTRVAWAGADWVAEVVSPDDPPRDHVRKRAEYAAAGVTEYWIVDPRDARRTVTVLTLDAAPPAYREHGVFGDGDTATSPLLPGLAVEVTACLDAR